MCFNRIFFLLNLLVKSNKCWQKVNHEHYSHIKNVYDGMGVAATPQL